MATRRWLVVSLVLLLVAACSGPIAPASSPPPPPSPTTTSTGASPSPTPTPTATATSTGASPSPTATGPEPTATGALPPPTPTASLAYALRVQSADGRLTVEAPDGAVPAGTTITVEQRAPDQAPPELVNAGVTRGCYELGPEGTQFSAPVKVTYTVPRDHYGDANNVPLLALATRSADGTWQWLSDAVVWLTDTTMAVAGWTTHFSCVYEWSDRSDLVVDPGAPRSDKVGTTFTRRISVISRDERIHEINFTNVIFYNYSSAVIAVGPDTSGTPSAPKSIITRDWTCLSVGPYHVEFWATANNFAADNPFWSSTLNVGQNIASVKIDLDGFCTGEEGVVDRACIIVHHEALGEYISWLEFILWFFGGYAVDYVEVTLQGANDDQPVRLDQVNAHVSGQLGLRGAGPKQLERVLVHLLDGTSFDITDEVRAELGDILVRFPEEDRIGECD